MSHGFNDNNEIGAVDFTTPADAMIAKEEAPFSWEDEESEEREQAARLAVRSLCQFIEFHFKFVGFVILHTVKIFIFVRIF